MFIDQNEEGISAGGIIGEEEATTVVVGIIIKVVAKTKVGPFVDGLEEGNLIVVGATGVTLGAPWCMFGTCATSIVEIKENTTIETTKVQTCAVAIDWGIGANNISLSVCS